MAMTKKIRAHIYMTISMVALFTTGVYAVIHMFN